MNFVKVRKKPIEVYAFRLTKDKLQFLLNNFANYDEISGGCSMDGQEYLEIKTLEGIMRANLNDWIIRGISGELYPCKSDIFDKTYDLLNEN